MRRKHKSFVLNLAIFGIYFMFAGLAVALVTPVSFRTADDSKILFETLLKQPKSEVLGASTEIYIEENLQNCPQDKPVIGWINYQGKKLIVTKLPLNEKPSSCFENIQKANEEGFGI